MFKKIYKFALPMALALVFAFNFPCATMVAEASHYTVTPQAGVLYSCNGTEVFTDADASTFVMTVPVNTPIEVTGITSNGFWQVAINGCTYYISQQALSLAPNTTAFRLTSLDAKAALVVNNTNGKLIYAQGATDILEPASTTKILTALLVVEAVEAGQITLDTPVVVSSTALASLPSDASHMDPRLMEGEVLTIDQLLTATLVSSDCQACNVLAEAIAGSVDNFTMLMNTRALQLGCTNTNFTNPSGYPDKKMYTNAYSLYLITAEAIKHPTFNKYFGLPSAVIPATNLYAAPRIIVNTDYLMIPGSAYYNPSVVGGKTGTAGRAGQCLVSVANQKEKTVIAVILGAKNRIMYNGATISMRYYESNRLIDMGFANYW